MQLGTYHLGILSMQYKREFEMALKIIQIVVKAITILKLGLRVSKLLFSDVMKQLAKTKLEDPSYISSNTVEVQRYVVTQRAMICRHFANYLDKWINSSAFIATL
jgi:DNA (cytosine-5)-methyltransferase 1